MYRIYSLVTRVRQCAFAAWASVSHRLQWILPTAWYSAALRGKMAGFCTGLTCATGLIAANKSDTHLTTCYNRESGYTKASNSNLAWHSAQRLAEWLLLDQGPGLVPAKWRVDLGQVPLRTQRRKGAMRLEPTSLVHLLQGRPIHWSSGRSIAPRHRRGHR